jgi:hypothetical protein
MISHYLVDAIQAIGLIATAAGVFYAASGWIDESKRPVLRRLIVGLIVAALNGGCNVIVEQTDPSPASEFLVTLVGATS